MTIKKILHSLEKFIYEINTESRLARVGLKKEQKIAPIVKKYQWLYSLPTINFVKKAYEEEKNEDNKKQLKLLFFELSESFLYSKIASLEDKIETFFNKSKVEVDKEKIAYYNLGPLISKTADFKKRESLQDAGWQVVKKANPQMLLMLKTALKSLKKDLGFVGQIDFYQKKKTINYSQFYHLVQEINSQLQGLYQEKMGKFVQENLNVPWKNLRNCHLSYLTGLNRFDQYFSKEKLMPVFEASMKDLGFFIKKQTNINIDTAERPGKNPRAVCYSSKVPEEIHLIIKPIGGFYDFTAFFHEAGHSEHYGNMQSSLPFAYRYLASSHASSELYSYLFESLTRNPLWLEKYLKLPKKVAKQVAYDSEIINFCLLIRYLGKFSYEYQLFLSGNFVKGPQLYAQTLTKFTNFIYNPVSYLNDIDSGFYSADYLRAWIGEAQLIVFLEKKFGQNWFERKEVGDLLQKMWEPGLKFDLEEILERNKIGKAFDIQPLISRFKKALV